MKHLTVKLAVVLCTAVGFSSCELDAPTINFSQVDNHVSDFSGLIDAINSQTKSLNEKLQLLSDAMSSQTLTLSEKMTAIVTAMDKNMLTQASKLELIEKAINASTNKLNDIKDAVKDASLALGGKIELLTTATKEA